MSELDERFYRPDPEQLNKVVPKIKKEDVKVSVVKVIIKGILEYLIKKL